MKARNGAVRCGGCADLCMYSMYKSFVLDNCPGNGNCKKCSGSGIEENSNNETKCLRCGGSGICPGCKGAGVILVS